MVKLVKEPAGYKNKPGGSKKRVLLVALSVFALQACAGQTTKTNTSVIDTSCLALEPIVYSRKDTVETTEQIRGHNAAWDALCEAPG